MDRITSSLLNEFIKNNEIENQNISDNFEDFCNFIIVANEYNKTFDYRVVSTGKGSDCGIDGICLIVNGNLVDSRDEIEDLLEVNGTLDITFIFIQAKTSSNFDTKEINNFYFGIQDFFSENPSLPKNDEIKKFLEISNYIFEQAASFKENPRLKSYFITTGVCNKCNENIKSVVDSSSCLLKSLNLFESINHNLIGASELGKLYRKTKNPLHATFSFEHKVILPEITGVDQAYYGYLSFIQFKKILIDENNNILSVFDDNVRDYQGISNPVNQNISDTLNNPNPNIFSVLNNGITVVANSVKVSGNRFTIEDYQIVNGCQTSNVLHKNISNNKLDDIVIPFRLIVTNDEDIKAKITVSTNSQTAIKKEQLSAMSDFQKNLEQYYNSIEGDGRLYYERRSKQYNADSSVMKKRIITMSNQIKTFSSMVKQNPHDVTSYYGKLVNNLGIKGSKLFETDHQFAMYYLAGLTFYRLENLFISGEIDKKYRKVKFYITMLIPLIASKEEIPPLNSLKKIEKYAKPIISILNDPNKCKKLFLKAVEIIDSSEARIEDKHSLKSTVMTKQILEEFKKNKAALISNK